MKVALTLIIIGGLMQITAAGMRMYDDKINEITVHYEQLLESERENCK